MLSRIALFSSALVLVCGLGFAEDAKEEKTVKLVHVESGKAVAPDGSEEDETKVVVVKDEAKPAQEWMIVKDGDSVKVVHKSCKKVLDVPGFSEDEGAEIIIYSDKGEENDNQRWSWVGDGAERRLKSKSSGLVLSVTDEGKVVQVKLDEKDKKQLWKVVDVKK